MSAAAATALTAAFAATAWLSRPECIPLSAPRPPGQTPAGPATTDTWPDGVVPDVVLIDLVVAALAAGLPAPAAVAAARSAATAAATYPSASPVQPLPAAIAQAFGLAERTGASAAELLRRAAADERSARRAAVAVAASRLGVRLVVPLGLTVLPAFVLLGVAPVVIGLAQQLLSA
ncbi:MAG: hypothetical protein ACTHN8_18635 [Angustibacter sp.]